MPSRALCSHSQVAALLRPKCACPVKLDGRCRMYCSHCGCVTMTWCSATIKKICFRVCVPLHICLRWSCKCSIEPLALKSVPKRRINVFSFAFTLSSSFHASSGPVFLFYCSIQPPSFSLTFCLK